MDAHQVFGLANNLAMISWLLMILLPRWKWTAKLIVGVSVTILAFTYAYYIIKTFDSSSFSSFGSLSGVMSLFTQPEAVLAGWIHYLAFDLMVGRFVLLDSQKLGISHFLIIPCLLGCFMLGPIGLLLYLLIRIVRTKSYFLEPAVLQQH